MSESNPTGQTPPPKDYKRQVSVVESFVAITRECPSDPVRAMAERKLEAIKRDSSAMAARQNERCFRHPRDRGF